MTELDRALEKYMQDEEEQSQYYERILNTDFYIPIVEAAEEDTEETATPLLFESDGKSYLMLFDSEKRLTDWAKQEIPFIVTAGYHIAELTTEELHWAVNIGGRFAKEFAPEEIGWLKEGTHEE